MKTVFKLIGLIAILSILTAGLSIPIGDMPPLRGLINPYNGIYETARLASHPEKAEIKSEFVSSDVSIVRDDLGVPYIFAESDEDLFYALGYAHAQDRLWQMDMLRRNSEGEMAEILGEEYVDDDKLMLRIGLKQSAERAVKKIRETHYIDLLRAYSRGVNRRIEEGDLPLEFKFLSYKPEAWKPKDTLAIAKLMSWGLSGTLGPIKHEEVAEKFGSENTWKELFPEETPYFSPIHEPPYYHTENSSPENHPNGAKTTDGMNGNPSQLLRDDKNSFWLFESSSSIGSNNWVVDDENSETGNPILASDPHLQLPLPSVWYQVYLNSNEGYHTAGVTFPGIPSILIGTNRNIAWGLTNISADDTDFYTYQTNPDKDQYLYDNKWKSFEENEVTIKVKGSEDVSISIKSTIHGPIVEPGENPIALKWTGHDSWAELEGMFKINKAGNLSQFKDGLQYWHCPPQNFAYADKFGNIALFSAGKYPLRENGLTGVGIQNGSNPKFDWGNYISFEEIPHSINPEKGYLSSANQDPVRENYPYYLGRFFAPGYRGRRIDNLLASKQSHGIQDFKKYQKDVFSVAAKEIVPHLLKAMEGKNLMPLANQSLETLREWNYEMDKEKSAPTIWSVWEMIFFRNIFEDEYKAKSASGLPLPRAIVEEKLVKEKPNSKWFDNVETAERENRDDIMIKSLDEAANLLRGQLGQNIEDWKWEKVNKIYFEHLTGFDALSRGPYPSSGSRVTLKVSPPAGTHPDPREMVKNGKLEFVAKHGQSWRMIVCPGKKYLGVYPGGQSQNPLSEHYDDMLKKYMNFEYNTISLPSSVDSMNENKIESRLLITPKR